MTHFERVEKCERLPDNVEYFQNLQTKKVKEYPIPRVKVVLKNGIELVLQEQGHSPRWTFKVRTDAQSNSLGVKYWMKDDGSIDNCELSGSQQDYDRFQKLLWEGFPKDESEKTDAEKFVDSGIKCIIDHVVRQRREFLASLVPMQSIVSISFRHNQTSTVGLYVRHDDHRVTIKRDGEEVQIAYLDTNRMKKL